MKQDWNHSVSANSPKQWIEAIQQTMNASFGQEEITKRKMVLTEGFSNLENAKKLIGLFDPKMHG